MRTLQEFTDGIMILFFNNDIEKLPQYLYDAISFSISSIDEAIIFGQFLKASKKSQSERIGHLDAIYNTNKLSKDNFEKIKSKKKTKELEKSKKRFDELMAKLHGLFRTYNITIDGGSAEKNDKSIINIVSGLLSFRFGE